MNHLLLAASDSKIPAFDFAALLPSALWMISATFAYDLIERRIETGTFRILQTGSFWLYISLHCLIGLPAIWLISGRFDLPWLAGVLSAINTVAILGNADVKVAGVTLAPLAKLFGNTRTQVDKELRDYQNTWSLELRDKLRLIPVAKLEIAWLATHSSVLGAVKAQQQLVALKSDFTNQDALVLALADGMVATNPLYVKRNLQKWK